MEASTPIQELVAKLKTAEISDAAEQLVIAKQLILVLQAKIAELELTSVKEHQAAEAIIEKAHEKADEMAYAVCL